MDKRIAKLISSAETHIESKDYEAALNELAAAERIDPENKSIKMIRDLVTSLNANPPRVSFMKNFFSATVDPKSPTGFAEKPEERVSDLQKRVQSLTSSADFFLSRGNVETAFESLMRAYLLDPVAPEVIACEQRVLPEWQKLHDNTTTETTREWSIALHTYPQKSQSPLFKRLKSGVLLK